MDGEGEARDSGRTGGGKPRCQAATKHGAPCAAFALPGRPWCITHDPERQADVRAARSRGGATASKLRALEGRRARLETPAQLLRFTGKLIHDVVDGVLDPKVAGTAFYGISIARQLADVTERAAVADRLAALEREGA